MPYFPSISYLCDIETCKIKVDNFVCFYLNRGFFDFFIFGFKFIMVLGLFVCCFICKFGAYKPWAVGGRSGFDGVRQPS